MSDRELLELAAKAAGYDCRWEGDGDFINLEDGLPWNPRDDDDDGDALRLAVKVRLTVEQWKTNEAVCYNKSGDGVYEDYGKDALAATRRAIVRAAAEIGRNMK